MHFQAKHVKYPNTLNINTCILWKLLHRFRPNFAPPNILVVYGWSKYAQYKSKMVDGRHFEKSINRNVLAPINTKFSTMMHNDPLNRRPTHSYKFQSLTI